MDRQTAAIYKRGAIFVIPFVAMVGCRVGLRACVAIHRSDRDHTPEKAIAAQQAERAGARPLRTAAAGSRTAPIASAQP